MSQTRSGSPGLRSLVATLIGGAALLAGTISVALDIALELRALRPNFNQLEAEIHNSQTLERITLWANLGGNYLGQSPPDAVTNFVAFANRVAGAIH